MSTKQLAPPPVQERPAPVRGRFLNFVEQRTRMVPSLWLGRAANMYSHEYIIPDLGAFEEALQRLFLILVLSLLPQTPRTSRGMLVALLTKFDR